jgi:beta-lactamase class A
MHLARRLAALLALPLAACAAPQRPAPAPAAAPLAALVAELDSLIRARTADTVEVAVALIDLESGDSLLREAHTVMHAASTMKVPVMLELFRAADAGRLRLDDSVVVRNEFRSIADGSRYSLSPDDDSDRALYERIGEGVAVRELIERMVTRSSNLATNLLIDAADPARIARTLDSFGASEVRVLRGVEDGPAYAAGMNNTTTAYGMMKVMEAIARGRAASPAATAEMLAILERQEFREMIPAGLPAGTRVANKTGWITGIHHDAAIVLPEGRAPYVLVVLTRGFRDTAAARATASEISARVYATIVGR